MMDSFLRGFGGQSEELKKAWEGKNNTTVNISEELNDILRVYAEAEERLMSKEQVHLDTATESMKRYILAREEREAITAKLNKLKNKLNKASHQEDKEDE